MSQAAQKNAEIIEKFRQDPAFKAQLLSDPVSALKTVDVEVKQGVEIKVVEDTETVRHLVIPVKTVALGDADLEGVAGGAPDVTVTDGQHMKIDGTKDQHIGKLDVTDGGSVTFG